MKPYEQSYNHSHHHSQLINHSHYSVLQYSNQKNQSNSTPIPCDFSHSGSFITINNSCLIHPTQALLTHNFEQVIETQRPDIQGFTQYYDTSNNHFNYQSPSPIRQDQTKQTISDYRAIHAQSINNTPAIRNQTITLQQSEWQIIIMNYYSYFAATRDISQYGSCMSRNFYVGAISVNTKRREPDQEFNVNKRVAYRQGYCTLGDEYAFYGGVCGVATTIFRISLLHPDIQVIERSPHLSRYNQYYGEEITGDDAAIAEFYKTLRLKNTSPYPIYFKHREVKPEKEIGIVAISPTNYYHHTTTTIHKRQTSELTATVTAQYSGTQAQSKEYTSSYTNIIQ